MDLQSGYWQVPIKESDRAKTAFVTADGLYHFKVMPMGLCSAPATFQRMMDVVLSGLKWTTCLVYLDDIIVPSWLTRGSCGVLLGPVSQTISGFREIFHFDLVCLGWA
jgi:hypothetical protein